MEREPYFYFSDQPMQIITPYFEHPPLMHLLVGAAAKLGGAGHWAHARLEDTRLVPIALSMLCGLGLTCALGRISRRVHLSRNELRITTSLFINRERAVARERIGDVRVGVGSRLHVFSTEGRRVLSTQFHQRADSEWIARRLRHALNPPSSTGTG